jgi:hypothetical protein
VNRLVEGGGGVYDFFEVTCGNVPDELQDLPSAFPLSLHSLSVHLPATRDVKPHSWHA